MSKVAILVVEDNADMRQAVSAYLRDQGYVVTNSPSAEQAIENRLYENIDLAILDISLPRMSGLELTQYLRSHGFSEPIIGLTARDTVDDKVVGLQTGMNDYIIKPFNLRELEARISAQLRTFGAHNGLRTVQTKNYRIEPSRHKFYVRGKEKKLTVVEFRLMLRLMQFNNSTVSSADLIEFAWNEDALTSNPPIRIHISNLRSKIGDTNLTAINTVPGIGYMLQD